MQTAPRSSPHSLRGVVQYATWSKYASSSAWNVSQNDRFFGRYSFATYEDQRDKQAFPLVFAARNDQPFYNVAFNWSRVFGPTIVNEVLAGFIVIGAWTVFAALRS